mmetsp:Transcript_16563/g.51966  ORF Transcript_16563/g.51966 Transcript_16563/m.51966 type:complete len:202 (+) Transcript_16563:1195-1800(+)
MAQSTVTPRPDSSFRMLTMFVAAAESRPLVGSSQSSSCGRPPTTARPTLRRRRSPPEMPLRPRRSSPMGVLAQVSSRREAMTASTRFSRSRARDLGENRSSAAKRSISRGVRAPRYTSSCGTTLAIWRMASVVTRLPLHRALPSTAEPGAARPRISVSSEVLPEPLAPMTAESLPAGKRQLTEERTVRAGAPPLLFSPGRR